MQQFYKRMLWFFSVILFSSSICCYGKELENQNHSVHSKKTPIKTLKFSGLIWNVREGTGGPGPNNWSSKNAWVDENGWLHLSITKINGKWYGGEIWSHNNFGFGQYWFYVDGLLDKMDPNVVLAFYNYPTPDIGPDETNEIDIEFSRWNDPDFYSARYTVWPYILGTGPTSQSFKLNQVDRHTTHGFTWNNKHILFQSCYGFDETCPNKQKIFSWNFAPSDYEERIPQQALPIHINLWLTHGLAPTNNKGMELVIRKFCFQPANGSEGNCL